jgi:hypothetical protein
VRHPERHNHPIRVEMLTPVEVDIASVLGEDHVRNAFAAGDVPPHWRPTVAAWLADRRNREAPPG